MEIIEIGATQLIFVLDRNEKAKYSIDTAENSPLIRDGFRRLVSDLGVRSDFLTGVLVQIFDSKSGGCEMFVTKIPDSIGLLSNIDDMPKKYIYLFPTLDDLIFACNMLFSKGFSKGSAFADRKSKRYYLVLEKDIKYLGEFKASICKDTVLEYLYEYCSSISENAIETLSALI